MNHSPLVSVLVLSYNRPKQLKEALNSISSQTYQNLEIIIGDDCSEDVEVKATINEFAEKDQRIRTFFQEENLGIIEHQKFLLMQISKESKYIMWACDDDEWHTDYIECCVKALETNPNAILCSSSAYLKLNDEKIEWSFEDSHTQGMKENHLRYYRILHNVLWWNHAFYGVIRKEAYEWVPLKHRFCFDILFICKLSLYGEFIKIPDPYITKRGQGIGSNLSSNLNAIKVQSRFVNEFPKLAVAFELVSDVIKSNKLNFIRKIGICFTIFKIVKNREMYSGEERNLIWKSKK